MAPTIDKVFEDGMYCLTAKNHAIMEINEWGSYNSLALKERCAIAIEGEVTTLRNLMEEYGHLVDFPAKFLEQVQLYARGHLGEAYNSERFQDIFKD